MRGDERERVGSPLGVAAQIFSRILGQRQADRVGMGGVPSGKPWKTQGFVVNSVRKLAGVEELWSGE